MQQANNWCHWQIEEARARGSIAGIDDHVEFIHCESCPSNFLLEGAHKSESGGIDQLNNVFKSESFDAIYGIETIFVSPLWKQGFFNLWNASLAIRRYRPSIRTIPADAPSRRKGDQASKIEIICLINVQLAFYEWCMSDEWDPAVPEHMSISQPIEYALHGAPLRTVSQVLNMIKDSGFEVKYHQDLASRDDQIPWYRSLEYPWRINYDNPLRSAWWFTCSNASDLRNHPMAQALLLGGRTKVRNPSYLCTQLTDRTHSFSLLWRSSWLRSPCLLDWWSCLIIMHWPFWSEMCIFLRHPKCSGMLRSKMDMSG